MLMACVVLVCMTPEVLTSSVVCKALLSICGMLLLACGRSTLAIVEASQTIVQAHGHPYIWFKGNECRNCSFTSQTR